MRSRLFRLRALGNDGQVGDYDLTRLGPIEFEHLAQALAMKHLGGRLRIYGAGPDGGRDATLTDHFHAGSGQTWSGYTVVQAKHRARPGTPASNVAWLARHIRRELAAWSNGRHDRYPDNLLFVTNVWISAAPGQGIDRIDSIFRNEAPSLRCYDVWHYDMVCRLLDDSPAVRRAYAGLITPGDVLSEMYQALITTSRHPGRPPTAQAAPSNPSTSRSFGEEFAGRERQMDALAAALSMTVEARLDCGMVWTGLHGVGKTALLTEAWSRTRQAGWMSAKIDGSRWASSPRSIAAAARAAVRVTKVLQRGGLSTDVSGSARTTGAANFNFHDLELDLTDVLAEAADMGSRGGHGFVLFIDDIDLLPLDDTRILSNAAHDVRAMGGRLLIVSTSLPGFQRKLAQTYPYLDSTLSFSQVCRLDPAATRSAFDAPSLRRGIKLTEGALAALGELSAGYPYRIQAYGRAVWELAASSPVTEVDVRACADAAEHDLEVNFYGRYLACTTAAEREYLHAIAEAGHGPARTSAVARHLGCRPGALSPVRDTVIRKRLAYSPRRGEIAFTVPNFDQFLRRVISTDSLRRRASRTNE